MTTGPMAGRQHDGALTTWLLHLEALLALAEDPVQRRHTFRDLHRVRRLGVVHYARHHALRPHPPIKPNRKRIHRRRK